MPRVNPMHMRKPKRWPKKVKYPSMMSNICTWMFKLKF